MRLPSFGRRTPARPARPSSRIGTDLVALGSAAVITIYAAGYLKTRAAAERFSDDAAPRRPGPEAITPAPIRTPLDARPETPAARPNPEPITATARTPETPTATRAAAAPSPTAAPPSKTTSTDAIAAPAELVSTVDTTDASSAPATAAAGTMTATPGATPTTAPLPGAWTPPAKPVYKDGTYLGWGTCRHGDIQAAVVIAGGKIASATIAQCWTRYSCDIIGMLPPQVAARQSPEVDWVSGATQSTNAFYYAVVDALDKAK